MLKEAPKAANDPAPTGSALPGARAALILLVFINLLNYVDRYVLAATVPFIKKTLFPAAASTSDLSRTNAPSWRAEWQRMEAAPLTPSLSPSEGERGTTGPTKGNHGALDHLPSTGGRSEGGDRSSMRALLDWCQQHLGFTPKNALIGVLSTAFMVVYMLGAPVFGRLAERRSRWVLIGVGVILWSLASGASGLAATFGVLLLTRCFVGIVEAAYGPVAPTIIADLYPVKVRGQVLAWFYMAIPVGTALGYIIGDVVAKSNIGSWGSRVFGGQPESWRWAFYLVVLPGLVLGLWNFFMNEPLRGQADLSQPAASRKASWRDCLVLLRTPSYVFCSLGMAAMTFALGGMAFWMPDYLETARGIKGNPTTIFGAITVASGLAATLLGGITGDKLRARFPGSYFLVSGVAMLLGFPLFLAVLKASGLWLWIFMFLTCFCLFFNTGPTNTILANVTHPSIRATGFALNIFIIHALGDVLSPVVIGILNDRYQDMNKAFLAVGLMFLVSGVLWLGGMVFLERDTRLAPERLTVQEPQGGSNESAS